MATLLFHALCRYPDSMVGLQVLSELYSVQTRKLKQDPATAKDAIESLAAILSQLGYTLVDVVAALHLTQDGVMSYRDGLLVSAAERSGCELSIPEDMQDGFVFGQLSVVSPFEDAGVGAVPREMLEMQRRAVFFNSTHQEPWKPAASGVPGSNN